MLLTALRLHRVPLVFIATLAAGARFVHSADINADGTTYDSHPAAFRSDDGTIWLAWHAHEDNRDQILARRIAADGRQSETTALSRHPVTSPPALVVTDASVFVIWSSQSEGKWSLWVRQYSGGQWAPATRLSTADEALYPAAARVGDEALIVAWASYRQGRFRIRARQWHTGTWRPLVEVSSGEFDAQRPAIAVDATGQAWIFWDEFNGDHYAVRGRQVLPERGHIESLTPAGDHALTPTALTTSSGLVVAWLQKVDVIGGPGVISQWHTLHAAVRRNGEWSQFEDHAGRTVAAELTQGLMAQITPRPIATGGYLGRRTSPMLAEVQGTLWLLWERKSDHTGSTWRVVGDLVGRPLRDGRWGETVTLHHGLVDYHLLEPSESMSSRITLLASRLPREKRRIYEQIEIDVQQATPFHQDRWEGWAPVSLPRREQLTERQSIEANGELYQLYWADLHCHSGLTADAEGQPDELLHYARDLAQLDVVVFTNNDFLYDVPLTGYEYAVNNMLARIYRRDDFLALPGYEWTSRVPGIATARVSDPGNWTPPYQFKSFPNHRSVIYPPEGGPLLHFPQIANDIDTLNRAVAAAGGITLTQHENFLTTGHPVEVAMELTSGWRRYIARKQDQFHAPLQQGKRLGFVACGDSHRRAPGLSGALTGIYAKSLASEDILAALRARRCFATSGSRIKLDARVNDAVMGSVTQTSDDALQVSLHAVGIQPLARATLIRDGREVRSFTGSGSRELQVTHTDENVERGEHWYYWRVEQSPETPDLPGNLNPAFGHLAWSSPIWVIVD